MHVYTNKTKRHFQKSTITKSEILYFILNHTKQFLTTIKFQSKFHMAPIDFSHQVCLSFVLLDTKLETQLTTIDTRIAITKQLLRRTSHPRVIIKHEVIQIQELVVHVDIADTAHKVRILDLEIRG